MTDFETCDETDLALKWPFRMLMAGCSGSGKSTLTTRLVARADRVMSRCPVRIVVFYTHMQEAYREMARVAPCPVELLDGAEHFTDAFATEPGTLVIVDDMQATHAQLVSAWFTRKSHHYDTSIIHLAQNVFDKGPSHRTISLNATYIVLFKNPRDMSQVSHLDRQAYPGGGGVLTAAYRDATATRPHSYVVMDFNQGTPEKLRLRNTLFPEDDFPAAVAYSPAPAAAAVVVRP